MTKSHFEQTTSAAAWSFNASLDISLNRTGVISSQFGHQTFGYFDRSIVGLVISPPFDLGIKIDSIA